MLGSCSLLERFRSVQLHIMAPRRKQQENGRNKNTSPSKGNNSKQSRKRHEDPQENCGTSVKCAQTWSYLAFICVVAVTFGILHRNHIAHLFESDRHFSHLSTLERELVFRTEMGLYYSYYKTMIHAPSLSEGLHRIMYDNVTEYPLTINTLKRFNLYPEVLLGGWFKLYEGVMSTFGIATKQCWQTNRGNNMPPIQSCEGLGDEAYFYVENVFFLNGVNMSVLFLFATYLSGNWLGGVITVASFFYNHGECTRVQWTPPLRESFAYPFLVIQMFIVTYVLKSCRPSYKHSIFIAIATTCFMLPWQFAQFALLTQCIAVFGVYVLQFIGSHKIKVILLGQAIGLISSSVLLFGNEMLFTSFFSASILSVYIVVLLEPYIEKLRLRPAIWAVQGTLWLLLTLAVKISMARLLQVSDDAHITDIFRSKFTDFKNFNSMLYVCAPEFDFMERETPWRVLKTLLAPCAVVAVLAVCWNIVRNEYCSWRSSVTEPTKYTVNSGVDNSLCDSSGSEYSTGSEVDNNNGNGHLYNSDVNVGNERAHRSKPHAELLFHVLQCIGYTVMAVLIMRLKLFWTPHLCLLASLLASKQVLPWPKFEYSRPALIFGLLGCMSVQGVSNLKHQWGIVGEFSNYPLEQMVYWINDNTPSNAVFAGPMPTMATIKLCTNRPIVNHPHYEDVGLRARTKKVYSMYSRKPESEVWQHMKDLQVNYTILEGSWCNMRPRPGCGMAEIWDLEDKDNLDAVPVCHRLKVNPGPYFQRVFKNDVYDVLKVLPHPKVHTNR